jgi:tRNA A37 threonylcarbamoyladenosine dehydratase
MGINFLGHGLSRGVTERKETQISVASLNSTQQDEMSAKLAGKVRIKFKSDYFKLDNFAKMYGGLSDEDLAEAKKGSDSK